MQLNSDSDLNKSYKEWPLSSPLYLYEKENLFLTQNIIENESEVIAKNVLHDLYALQNKNEMRNNNDNTNDNSNNQIFQEIQDIESKYSGNIVYSKFMDIFSPKMKSLFKIPPHDLYVEIVGESVSIFERIDVGVSCFMKNNFMNLELLQKIIDYEYDISIENCICLYRATTNIQADSTIRDNQQHSLSFSLSLFSGVLHDKTATVYTKLFCIPDTTLYSIKLNLSDFIDKNSSSNKTFFIPPIPCIIQLSGIGEFFHCRTKVIFSEEELESKDQFISGIFNCSYSRVPYFLTTSNNEYFTHFKSLATIFTSTCPKEPIPLHGLNM